MVGSWLAPYDRRQLFDGTSPASLKGCAAWFRSSTVRGKHTKTGVFVEIGRVVAPWWVLQTCIHQKKLVGSWLGVSLFQHIAELSVEFASTIARKPVSVSRMAEAVRSNVAKRRFMFWMTWDKEHEGTSSFKPLRFSA